MSTDPISQAEIDALLRGDAGPEPEAATGSAVLGDVALQALRRAAEPALDAAWSVAEALLGQPAGIANLTVQELPAAQAAALFGPALIYGRLTLGHLGQVCAMVPEPVALELVGQMLGGDAPGELSATGAAALAEALGQLVTKGVVKLASQAGLQIIPSPVEVIPAAAAPAAGVPAEDEGVVLLRHDVLLGDMSGSIGIMLPPDLARGLAEGLRPPAPAQAAPAPPAPAPPAPAPAAGAPAPPAPAPAAAAPAPPAPAPAAAAPAPPAGETATPVTFSQFQFQDLSPTGQTAEPRNIDLLLDVPLQVTVELGRTRKQIREVLALGPGSVLELEKLAGEPVDVLVNGKLIAKGEVVVIDEHFGVRITDIVSPAERAASLKDR